jgi:hypothetical protein
LIEVRFLTVVRSAFGSINSDDFTANQLSIFKKKTKSLNRFLIPMDILLSKVGYTMVVGMIAHKTIQFDIERTPFLAFLRSADHLDTHTNRF